MTNARSQSMRAQNSDSDPIFVNNFTCPSVGKTMHYAFTSIFLDACVQDQRRQFFPHGSNIYSSDIEFLVNGVSNLLIYLVAFPHASNIYYQLIRHSVSGYSLRWTMRWSGILEWSV